KLLYTIVSSNLTLTSLSVHLSSYYTFQSTSPDCRSSGSPSANRLLMFNLNHFLLTGSALVKFTQTQVTLHSISLVLQLYPALVHRLPIQMAGETVTCSWYPEVSPPEVLFLRFETSGGLVSGPLTEVLAHPILFTSVLIFLGLAF